MYFQAKNTLKNNRYHTPKPDSNYCLQLESVFCLFLYFKFLKKF